MATGHWAAPSGGGFSYELSPDGHYVYASVVQSSVYNCTMTYFRYETGTWGVQGATMSFSPTFGTVKSEDSCNKSYNYERPATLARKNVTFALTLNGNTHEEQLCLTDKGKEICYRREPR